MDKFQALLTFRTVTEWGGFTPAASKLGLSPSAVTKSIAGLEHELGVRLFNRTTRRIALTDAGQQFYERTLDILGSLEAAEASMRDTNVAPRGRVNIVMPNSFGRVTVAPELPGFVARHPDITLDIHFNDEPVDMIKEGYDLAVLARELVDSRLIRRILHKGPQLTVASPDYLKRYGTPATPGDLKSHHCVIGNFGDEWRFQDEHARPFSVKVMGRVTLHNGDAMREAAVSGLGIAQSTWWLFRKDIERGALVPILDRYALPGLPVSVLFPEKRYMPGKVAAVIQFLADITKAPYERPQRGKVRSGAG